MLGQTTFKLSLQLQEFDFEIYNNIDRDKSNLLSIEC